MKIKLERRGIILIPESKWDKDAIDELYKYGIDSMEFRKDRTWGTLNIKFKDEKNE